jgi:hypothetical protein
MITAPTTFVIGAGGSCPYGLPTGSDLKQKAIDSRPESDLYKLTDLANG